MSDLEGLKRSRAAKLGWLSRAVDALDKLVLTSKTEGTEAVDKIELEEAVAAPAPAHKQLTLWDLKYLTKGKIQAAPEN